MRCLEEKGLLVEEEVLIVDCGSLKMKGIPWKGAYIDGRRWWVLEQEFWTAIVHWLWIETGGSCNMSDRVKLTVYESRIP